MSGPISIDTALSPGAIEFLAMFGTEALGQPFLFELDVLSTRSDLKPADLLGQSVSLHLETANFGTRHFNGIATRLEYRGTGPSRSAYRITLRPWFWLLTQSVNSRVFQLHAIPDIIAGIFREHGFANFSESLSETYPPLDYVVQYRETDFDFVVRLMERAGIYYFFRHDADKHDLVMADSYGAHDKVPGYETLPFRPPDPHRDAALEFIEEWRLTDQVRPGTYSHADFDFTRPALRLYSTLSAPKDHVGSGSEVYEYPGRFVENADGDAVARLRLQQRQMAFEVALGTSNARGLTVGSLFTLADHPRADQNTEHLVVRAEYELRGHDIVSGAADQDTFRCTFEAQDSKAPYRLARSSEKPVMRGPQTATVVGKDGEEIWTDEFGRVKIQFHWDREGQLNEKSSCFVRVAQAWAGAGWGAIHIPRVGQEVIVDFLEGDPDQPIVTGRVYNGENKPPYALPANQSQSGIKSRSTKGGTDSNFNEIRFEDKKGSEELFMQAEKNHTTLVKNNQSTTVKANRSAGVSGSDTISVGGDRSVHVSGNLSVTVDGGGKSPVHSETTVTGKHALHASDTIEMDAPTHIKFTCGDSSVLIEPGKITIIAGGKAQVVLDANVLAQANGGAKMQLDANVLAQSNDGAKLQLDPNVLMQSKNGSKVQLDANAATETSGDVTIKGMTVTGEGQTQATLKVASNSVQLSPSGAAVAGATVNVNGTGMVSIAGPMIKIG